MAPSLSYKIWKFLIGFVGGVLLGILVFSSLRCVAERPPPNPPIVSDKYEIDFGDGSKPPIVRKNGNVIDTVILVIE